MIFNNHTHFSSFPVSVAILPLSFLSLTAPLFFIMFPFPFRSILNVYSALPTWELHPFLSIPTSATLSLSKFLLNSHFTFDIISVPTLWPVTGSSYPRSTVYVPLLDISSLVFSHRISSSFWLLASPTLRPALVFAASLVSTETEDHQDVKKSAPASTTTHIRTHPWWWKRLSHCVSIEFSLCLTCATLCTAWMISTVFPMCQNRKECTNNSFMATTYDSLTGWKHNPKHVNEQQFTLLVIVTMQGKLALE